MNQPDSRLGEIGKVMYAFRISFAHENHERRFVDDPLLWQRPPIRSYQPIIFEPLRVALDRKNRYLGFYALEDLIGDRLRSGERRGEVDVEAMLSFHLRRERRVNRFLERLFHDRKTIDSNVDAAARLRGRFWQTSVYGQQQENRNGDNRGPALPKPHGHLSYRSCSPGGTECLVKVGGLPTRREHRKPVLTLLDFNVDSTLG